MNFLKYFTLILTLLIQACEPEPLFLEKDGMNADEGIVVYSFYNPIYQGTVSEANIYGADYAGAFWENRDNTNIYKGVAPHNYLKAEGAVLRYATMKLKAGEYFLNSFNIRTQTCSHIWHFSNKTEYTYENSPIQFTIKAGEVLYIGNFVFEFYPSDTFKIKRTDYFNEAKSILLKHYPTYAPKLKPMQNK